MFFFTDLVLFIHSKHYQRKIVVFGWMQWTARSLCMFMHRNLQMLTRYSCNKITTTQIQISPPKLKWIFLKYQPLTPLPSFLQPTYLLPMLFIIPTLNNNNVTKKSHIQARIPKILKSSKNYNCYYKCAFTTAQFCIMKQKKTMETNLTQMLNRKSTNKPQFQFSLCIKGVFVHFLLNIWVQFAWFMLSN